MKISRNDLYCQVWAVPLTKLAKEFDISDVGLAKACQKHSIPTPPVGYWAKVAHGKPVMKPALPKSNHATVVLSPSNHRITAPGANSATPATPAPVVTVRRDTGELAGAAASTFLALNKTRPDADAFVRSGSSVAFSCVLSVSSIQRAALVLDAIERALPQAGVKLIRDRDAKCIALEAEGERIAILLSENYTRTEPITKDPTIDWIQRKDYGYAFSGTLKLTLGANCYGRKVWSDGVRAKLEDRLGSFIVGIVEAARAVRAEREAREEQQRTWEEQSHLSRIAAEKTRRLQAFNGNFVAEAAAWSRYQEARAYLDHLMRHVPQQPQTLPGVSLAWLAQAEEAVEQLNPGIERMGRLLDGYLSPDWLAPFGETIVSSHTRFG